MSSGNNKLFVGNLAWTTNTGSLQSTFSQFGQVVDAVVMQDRETGRSRGFGFITFAKEEEALAAINGLNEQEIDGRLVRVNYANSQGGGGGAGGGRQGGGGGGYRGGGGGGGYNQSYGGGGGGYGGQGYGGGGGGYGGNGGDYQQQGGGGGGWRNQGNNGGGGGGW